jgi:nucleoside-diphosphate-sugar epimerase
MLVMNNKINVLITGSTGFIGSYFINQYSSQFVVNTFSFLRDNFDTLKLDGIDCVVHCGALVHQMKREPSYEEFFDSNVNHTLQMAIKAKANNVKQFIFISTIKVFGEESKKIFDENSPTSPKDDYGLTKKIAEEKLFELEDKNFKVAILRLPLVFGPGVKANFRSLINIVNQFKILPLGSINNKRSIVFVGNVCHYIFQIIKLRERGIFIANEDESFSTSELINQISKALGKNIILFSIPLFNQILKIVKPKYYQRLFENLEVDNSLTKKILKIKKNKYSCNQSFKETISTYVK